MTDSNDDEFVTTSHPFEGLVNGEERLVKAQLARQINSLIKERGLKKKAASELLGIRQTEVSQINNGSLSGFSFDRLYRCLHALDKKYLEQRNREADEAWNRYQETGEAIAYDIVVKERGFNNFPVLTCLLAPQKH